MLCCSRQAHSFDFTLAHFISLFFVFSIDFLTTIHKRQHSLIQELKTKLKELQQIQQQTATSLIKISNFQESLTERTGKLLHRINNFHPLSEAEKKYLKELKKFQLQVAEYNKKIEELKLQTEKFQNLKEPFPLISLNKEQQEEIIRALKKNKKKIWQNVSKLRELQKQMDMMQMYDS
jgi:chromosome segregation ATPase